MFSKTVYEAQWLHACERELDAKFRGDHAMSLRWMEVRKAALAFYNAACEKEG